jgi:hypothetical protein
MHNWRQSPAVVILGVLLLIILLAIHLATFLAGTAALLPAWSDWIPTFGSLVLLGNIIFAQIVAPTKRQQETSPDSNWRKKLWPLTPRSLLFWLTLGYLALLLYFAIFAPDVAKDQRDIYRWRYYSALGVYSVWIWLPGIVMQRRKQAGEGQPPART